jgi:poly-gamma-glutamate synthesis protein (capsule biosynthesis protein)
LNPSTDKIFPVRRAPRGRTGPKSKAFILVVGLLLAIPLFSACGDDRNALSEPPGATDPGISVEADAEASVKALPETPVSLRILCAGDVMVHEPQLAAQRDSATGEYDFSNNFQYVQPYVSGADLALCNLETTFGGEPYKGYPCFSSPDRLAEALAGAGFDAVFTSNNHMLDTGAAGLRRTLEVAGAAGLGTTGSCPEGGKNYLVVSRSGVNIGLVSFTYESPRAGGRRTLNGIYIPDALLPFVNSFGYEELDADLAAVETAIGAARADGAELVVCYFHWGNEYQRKPNAYQEHIASRAAIAGADIIFASHPHVLQGMDFLTPGPGRTVPVFYSMGNFISNQRTETTGDVYTEQGMMAVVDLRFLKSRGAVVRMDAKVLPTWVDKYRSGGKDVYAIVPLDEHMGENPALAESGHITRAEQALEYCRGLFPGQLLPSAA